MQGVNPKQMKKMMRNMGIEQEDLQAVEVIIRLVDRELVVHNPQVAKVTMMGQVTFQVIGQVEERKTEPEIDEDDVEEVMAQAEVSEDVARAALMDAGGDIAKAILSLTQKDEKA